MALWMDFAAELLALVNILQGAEDQGGLVRLKSSSGGTKRLSLVPRGGCVASEREAKRRVDIKLDKSRESEVGRQGKKGSRKAKIEESRVVELDTPRESEVERQGKKGSRETKRGKESRKPKNGKREAKRRREIKLDKEIVQQDGKEGRNRGKRRREIKQRR